MKIGLNGIGFQDVIITIILRFFKGLPNFEISEKNSLFLNQFIVFLNYLSFDYDSHLLRKFGIEKASKIKLKASILKKIKNRKNGCFNEKI